MAETAILTADKTAAATAPDKTAQVAADKVAAPTDWHETLPTELRADPTLLKYKTPEDAHRAHLEAVKLIGKKTEGMVKVPTATSSPEEKAAFAKAIGTPGTADEYKFDVAEDFKPILTDEALGRYRPVFHKLGLSSTQAQGLAQAFAEDQIHQVIVRQQGWKEEQTSRRDEIGQATWDRNMAMAEAGVNYAVAKLGDVGQRFKTEILDGMLLGDHPAMIEFMSLIGRELEEDGKVQVEGAQGGMLETAKQYIIDALKLGHPAMNPADPGHEAALAKRLEYRRMVELYDPKWSPIQRD